MSFVNDVGGMHGFGPVPAHDPPRANQPWSARMWAINQALIARGLYNFDHYRHAVERMDPAAYFLAASDERRLVAVEALTRERLVIGAGQLAAHAGVPRTSAPVPAAAESFEAPARFAVGATVAVRPDNPPTHTRTPRYMRGRRGQVRALRGRSVPPEDRVADDLTAAAQQIYSVRFEAVELWGEQGGSQAPVLADLWERWLEPV